MDNLAIIIQGPSNYVNQIKNSFIGYDLIFSTWSGSQSKYEITDVVIYNELPIYSGPSNMNLQKITTINGLLKAKELGYSKALKIRSDLIPNNINEFIKLLNNDKLNFLSWHYHEVYDNCPGYLIDYLMSGYIDDLIDLWDINDMSSCNVPEIILTQRYISKLMDKVDINYFLDGLSVNNDLFWLKNGISLKSYQVNNTYDKYRKFEFGLNNEYIKFLK